MGPPVLHGAELKLSGKAAHPDPDVTTSTETSQYGTAEARAWNRAHPRLTHRRAWTGHEGKLPVIEGTLIKLTVDHLPHEHDPKPVWLWTSDPATDPAEANLYWQAFLRRFDIEHTHPVPETGPRLDPPETARPGRRRPPDLAHHRRPYPAVARPQPG